MWFIVHILLRCFTDFQLRETSSFISQNAFRVQENGWAFAFEIKLPGQKSRFSPSEIGSANFFVFTLFRASCSTLITPPPLPPMHDLWCAVWAGSYSCSCPAGYTAREGGCHDVDECQLSNQTCGRHGDCTNLPGTFTCACHPGKSSRSAEYQAYRVAVATNHWRKI